MPDSSDDFFNSFSNSPVRPTQQQQRPPPPPAPGRGPPPGPPPFKQNSNKQPMSNTSSYMLQQPAGQPAAQPGYYGRGPTGQQQAPPTAAAPNNPSATNMYHSQQHQQQQQQHNQFAPQYHQQQQPSASSTSSSDWYTPPPNAVSSMGTTMQPQQQQQMYNNNINAYGMEGSMDQSGRSYGSGGGATNAHVFIPSQPSSTHTPRNDIDEFDNEPPLLEELGVNIEHIVMKTKAVVIPFRSLQKQSALADPNMIVEDADLAGPLAFALLLGGELLMTGKMQFGYIYGFGLFGCLSMTLVLNLMSPEKAISFWTVTSILGYALLPVNILAALKIILFFIFGPLLTQILATITVIWSTTASTRLLEIGCGLEKQRYLIAYPIALLYSAFVLITIF